jgi:hypothetical protein
MNSPGIDAKSQGGCLCAARNADSPGGRIVAAISIAGSPMARAFGAVAQADFCYGDTVAEALPSRWVTGRPFAARRSISDTGGRSASCSQRTGGLDRRCT